MEGYATLSEAELRRILAGVEGVPAQVAGHDFRLDRHDETLANHETRIDTLEALVTSPVDLTTLQAEVAGHEVRLDNHDIDIGTLSSRADGHDASIAALQAHAVRVVTNYTELLAAMATPGKIFVRGLITCGAGLISTTEDLDWEADGAGSGFLLPHNGTSQQTVMWVKAKRNRFKNLLFTTNHPLTSGRAFQDIGLRLAVTAGEDCSGLVVDNCRFENLAWGILRDGSSSSAVLDSVLIKHCKFKGFYQGCIYLRWFCHNLTIFDCDFEQRTASQTHDIEYNAVYIANRCDRIGVDLCRIRRFGRHGVEIWNDSDDILAADSNLDAQVTRCTIEEPLPWSTYTPIGITILGKGTARYHGNVVRDCVIAYELGGDPVNDCYHIATGNTAERTKNQAFSVNNPGKALVENNVIKRVAVDGFPGIPNTPVGVQIINGGRNIKVRENSFVDAGRFNIWVNGKSLLITGITQAADAVFTVSAPIADTLRPNGWYVGKRICLRGVGGMTALNDKYYTITEVSGSTFKLGVDTSAMPAYTSGGRVQEDYVGLSICDNEMYVYDEIDPAWSGPSSFARSIYVYDFQDALVRNNTRWGRNTLNGYWGAFSVQNYGTVYHDDAGGTVSTTAAEVVIAGSNTNIPVFP
jgi:hypothetical protein